MQHFPGLRAGFTIGCLISIIIAIYSINLNWFWNNYHDFFIFFLFTLAIKSAMWSGIGLMMDIMVLAIKQICGLRILVDNSTKVISFAMSVLAILFYATLQMNLLINIPAQGYIAPVVTTTIIVGTLSAKPAAGLFFKKINAISVANKALNTALLVAVVFLLVGLWVIDHLGMQNHGEILSMNNRINKAKILLIGLDAAGWDVILPMTKAGKLPNLEKLMNNGLYGELETLDTVYSPVIWTTIASGKSFNKHGVSFYVKYRIAGAHYSISMPSGFVLGTLLGHLSRVTNMGLCEPIAVTGRSVKTNRIWDIVSAADGSVGVFGWWCTAPASRVHGYILSDKYDEMVLAEQENIHINDAAWPPGLAEILKSYTSRLRQKAKDRLSHFTGLSQEQVDEILCCQDYPKHEALSLLRRVCFEDLLQRQASEMILKEDSPDFVAVYFRGIDIVGHYYWKYFRPFEYKFSVPQEEIKTYGHAIEKYYEFIDESIGRVVSAAGQDYTVIVVSDHRMVPVNRDNPDAQRSGGHFEKRHSGIIICCGTPFKKIGRIDTATVFDITPTILSILGYL
jgi:predicted AlkP superfamily phosphohydrolase/phosphomutase